MKTNRKRIARGRVACLIFSMIACGATAAENSEVAFPEGYRSWQHVKSVVVEPDHKSPTGETGKIFHFYANPQAVDGYREGRFPNGAIIVRETLHAIASEGDSKNVLTEGTRSALDVMAKDDRLYKETGGWGFETFDSNNARLSEQGRAQCYACHSKQKDHDLVFTTLSQAAEMGTPYPEGYRQWTFLHSSMVSPATFEVFAKKPCEKPCMGGIFHFYANDKAMAGLRTGSYPDGAILAEEMLDWLPTASGGAKEGQRRLIGVMVRNSQRYSATGGWGYGMFDDGSNIDRLDAKQHEACYQCHIPRKDQGYVFTVYRQR